MTYASIRRDYKIDIRGEGFTSNHRSYLFATPTYKSALSKTPSAGGSIPTDLHTFVVPYAETDRPFVSQWPLEEEKEG
ncbi:MAG: hypothetical protein IJ640_02685 [Prevotella sp.]|nr:hypothetical protein [Prevotella sp.]